MGCCQKNLCCKSNQNSSEQDYLVCTCMGVMKSEILEAIDSGLTTFDELSDELGVGTGCSSCVEEVQQMLAQKVKKSCCQG